MNVIQDDEMESAPQRIFILLLDLHLVRLFLLLLLFMLFFFSRLLSHQLLKNNVDILVQPLTRILSVALGGVDAQHPLHKDLLQNKEEEGQEKIGRRKEKRNTRRRRRRRRRRRKRKNKVRLK